MPKKLLLSVLVSALFAVPASAQETGTVQGAESSISGAASQSAHAVDGSTPLEVSASFQELTAEGLLEPDTNVKSQEQVAAGSQSQEENVILRAIKAVGSAYASGKVIDPDELAGDWQAAQNPDVEAKAKKAESSQPKGENVILWFIKAVGRAYASGKVVDTDELAGDWETVQNPDVKASVVPTTSGNVTVQSSEEPAEKTAEVSSRTVETPSTAQPQAVAGQDAGTDLKQVEKTVSGQPVETAAGQTAESTKLAERSQGQEKASPVPQDISQSGSVRHFPEVVPSSWQDQLPKEMTLAEMTEKALAGNPEAQYRLGMACYYGKSVQKDDGKAFLWWRQSALKGYPKAMHIMGVAYRRGIGVPKHAEMALDWFTKAAQQGRAIDQYIVADAYYEAKVNNVRDDALAVYWATHAARQGHPGALVLLAQAKLEGRGMPPNMIHAYVLAGKAAEFDRDAYAVVDEIEKSLSDEQQEIAKTVTLEDALKPTPLASLLVQKQTEGKNVQPSTGQSDGPATGQPKTDNPIESVEND